MDIDVGPAIVAIVENGVFIPIAIVVRKRHPHQYTHAEPDKRRSCLVIIVLLNVNNLRVVYGHINDFRVRRHDLDDFLLDLHNLFFVGIEQAALFGQFAHMLYCFHDISLLCNNRRA